METVGVKRPYPAKVRVLAIYISAILGAFIFISILGQQSFQVEALRVRMSIQPAVSGYTTVDIPPLVAITAKTHATPLKIFARLDKIDLQSAQKMLNNKQEPAGLMQKITGSLRTAAILFGLKILLLSAAGGAFGVLLWNRNPGIRHLQGALAATLTIGALFWGTYATYDINKFKNPEFEGLKVDPGIISMAGQSLGKIDSLNNKMETIANNVSQLFNQIDELQTFDEGRQGVVKVLHVSDIHNNPAALKFIQRIASAFKVDLIIDTGDITDYGTPLEGLLLERLAGLKVPYIYIPGNHDSPETAKKMKSIPGVTVLSGNTVTVKNLRITGFPDSASATGDIEPPPLSLIPQLAGDIEKKLAPQPDTPDILALHNHRIAKLLTGKAPVILYGHDHKLAVEEINGSIMIDAGSSGAAGMRKLQGDKTPYTVVLQYYAPEGGKMKLLAADTIMVKNLESGFNVERHIFKAPGPTN